MKDFKAIVTMYTLVGESTRTYTVKAKTEDSARKKVYRLIGDRDGFIISLEALSSPV